jgi:glycerate 2-kinase
VLREHALAIFDAAVRAAHGADAVRHHLAGNRDWLSEFDRVFLVSAGKAALEMAAATEEICGPRLTDGIVVTKYGHAHAAVRSRVYETGHPIPDEVGVAASKAVCKMLTGLTARDRVIVLVSGGASALLPAPAEPVTLDAKQKTTDLLLRAGATIGQLNAVRKHLSRLKGGRLAALAQPATVLGLLLSDVIGDRLDVIGSGPTAPDATTFKDAVEVLKTFDLLERVPHRVRRHLEAGLRGEIAETPKPGDRIFDNVQNVVVGSNRLALEAAARQARELGYEVIILSSCIEGEAREVARAHAERLRGAARRKQRICILSGGETTVTVRGAGKGGRNQEFALAAAIAIEDLDDVLVLSAGTDGTDGPTDAAGAIATGDTIARARTIGLNAREHLDRNNSYEFFDALGDLVRTGPTGTNVMDIHLMLAAGS